MCVCVCVCVCHWRHRMETRLCGTCVGTVRKLGPQDRVQSCMLQLRCLEFSVSRPMSNTEFLRIQCRYRNRTGYLHNILDSTQVTSEALTSSLKLGRRGLFPRRVKRTGHEAGHSPPTSADVKNEWRSTSTLPYFFMAWYLIRYMDRPDNLSQCHRIPQQEGWGNTACKQALQKNDSMRMITITQDPTYLFNYSATCSTDNRSHKNMAKNKTN